MVESSSEQEADGDEVKVEAKKRLEALAAGKVIHAGSELVETGDEAEAEKVGGEVEAEKVGEAEKVIKLSTGADTEVEAKKRLEALAVGKDINAGSKLVETGDEVEAEKVGGEVEAEKVGEAEKVIKLSTESDTEVASHADRDTTPGQASRLSVNAPEFKLGSSKLAAVRPSPTFTPHAGAVHPSHRPYPYAYPRHHTGPYNPSHAYPPYHAGPFNPSHAGPPVPSLAVGHHTSEGNQFISRIHAEDTPSWDDFSPIRPIHHPEIYGSSYPTSSWMPPHARVHAHAPSEADNLIPAGGHLQHPPLTQQQQQPDVFRPLHQSGPQTPQRDLGSASDFSGSSSGSSSSQKRRSLRHASRITQTGFTSPISFPPLGGSSISPNNLRPSLSYAAKQLSEADRKKWQDKMLDFLNCEDCHPYRQQVQTLSGVHLRVDFRDILMKDEELGLELCRTQGTNEFWLQQVADNFFKDNGVKEGLTGSFTFVDMPARLRSARDVLDSEVRSKVKSILNGKLTIHEASEHGKRTLDTIVDGILDYLAIGMTFDGELKLGHLFIEEDEMSNMKLFISKKPKVEQNVRKRPGGLKDLGAVWKEVETFYVLPNGKLPLYFQQLKHDLTNAKELSPWFIEYLRHHPAFYSSLPCRNFIEAAQKICKIKKAPSQPQFRSIFSRPPIPGDWQDDAKLSDALLLVFDYISPAEKRLQTEKLQQAVEKAKTEGKKIPVSFAELGQQSTRQMRYQNTTDSLLDFKRNGLEHLYEHFTIADLDELELFLAHAFPNLLPDLLKGLLMPSQICCQTYSKDC